MKTTLANPESKITTQRTSVLLVDSLVGNDYAVCLGNGLVKAGQPLSLVTVSERKTSLEAFFSVLRWAPSKLPSTSSFTKLTGYISYLFRLLTYVLRHRKEKPVLHFQFFRIRRIEPLFLRVLRWAGARIVFTAHNILPHEQSNMDMYIQQHLYNTCHAIIVHSSFIKKELMKMFDVPDDRIHVIPHGNFDHYLPEVLPERGDARSRLGISEEEEVVLFFGYIRHYKGLDLLIDAFKKVMDQYPDRPLRLLIAGDSHEKHGSGPIFSQIQRLNLEDQVTFHHRFVPDEEVATYFMASDLVALPYRNIYHSGLVHLAFSFQKPVLASPVGDFPETIVDSQTGLLLDEVSVECIATGLIEALNDPERLIRMGKEAKRMSKEKYSWDRIGLQTMAVYEQIK